MDWLGESLGFKTMDDWYNIKIANFKHGWQLLGILNNLILFLKVLILKNTFTIKRNVPKQCSKNCNDSVSTTSMAILEI